MPRIAVEIRSDRPSAPESGSEISCTSQERLQRNRESLQSRPPPTGEFNQTVDKSDRGIGTLTFSSLEHTHLSFVCSLSHLDANAALLRRLRQGQSRTVPQSTRQATCDQWHVERR